MIDSGQLPASSAVAASRVCPLLIGVPTVRMDGPAARTDGPSTVGSVAGWCALTIFVSAHHGPTLCPPCGDACWR